MIQEVPKGLTAHTALPATYERHQILGAFPENLVKAWEQVWAEDPKKRAFQTDFEHYGPAFNAPTPQVDLYIGVL